MACDHAALRWRCRRGMLELDIWLNRFLDRHEPLNALDCAGLLHLLAAEDDQLYDWLLGRSAAPEAWADLVLRIRETR
ncbi:MAG: succinate dehydrogenase assembly factor 2 [Betaproteobacteria bacterium]|nr:MAG: succinate dehydrogenase assembly factor 2 [Betaproteobacteria bacterium]